MIMIFGFCLFVRIQMSLNITSTHSCKTSVDNVQNNLWDVCLWRSFVVDSFEERLRQSLFVSCEKGEKVRNGGIPYFKIFTQVAAWLLQSRPSDEFHHICCFLEQEWHVHVVRFGMYDNIVLNTRIFIQTYLIWLGWKTKSHGEVKTDSISP